MGNRIRYFLKLGNHEDQGNVIPGDGDGRDNRDGLQRRRRDFDLDNFIGNDLR